ncbi:MAG: isochorismatase family protein [Thermoplasmata archaeon]|nr:isochorismatase family protein [Thermoplasmata archaeon]
MDCLVVIDFQDRIAKHVLNFENVRKNTEKLIRAFEIMKGKIIYTKQIKLGEPIFGDDAIEKDTFSCYRNDKFVDEVKACSRIILAGIEAHICVLQTAVDLKNAGYEVVVAADCISSRNKIDMDIAILRMMQEGIKLSTFESIVYEMLGSATSKHFKDILKIVKK